MADAVAVWHLGDTNDAAGANSALTLQGNVTLGVPLEGAERAASLSRHGDERVAFFEGGWLSAGQGCARQWSMDLESSGYGEAFREVWFTPKGLDSEAQGPVPPRNTTLG